jgi:type IV fimbrial biogenesis protein FimT
VLMPRAQRSAGFGLIELMVTITLLSILMALAVPSMGAWIRNNKIRTVADSLQNGLRLAQTEALRRSRQVVFSLTNSTAPQTSLTAAADGRNWSINVVKLMTDESDGAFVGSGVLGSLGSDVQIVGPAAVCFNSVGRLVANSATGVSGSATCSAAANPTTYNVTLVTPTGADRPLRVLVALGGQVRICDPNRSLSAGQADGCP